MDKNLDILLRYYDYPESIRRSGGESRSLIPCQQRRGQRRSSITGEVNEARSQRTLRGFYKCRDQIREMF